MSKFANYPSLEDRVIVISGGATGIGSSMVKLFANQSSQMVILDIQDQPAQDLIDELSRAKVKHAPIFYHCDITNTDSELKPTAQKILDRFPAIHGVINNAAHARRIKTMDVSVKDWDSGLDINLKHQFFLTQALLPGLIRAGSSSIINMGSITWARPGQDQAPYIASKAAIVGLTKTLAHEFGPQGVRVNSIMPGAIATERERREVITPEYEALILQMQALKRLLEPEEVARLALWLMADDSSGVTSQSIVIDAGWI